MILVISLGGLLYIQYRMLTAYYSLSREKLDQQIALTLTRTGEETYERTLLSNLISAIVTEDTVSFPIGMDSLRRAGTRFYGMYLEDRFNQEGLPSGFEFAVLDQLTGKTYLASKNYSQEVQWLGNYKLPLEGVITQDCGCAPYLNVRFSGFESILLQGIQPVLLPALACFLLLVLGFYLLLRILREQRYLDRVKNDFINNLTHELKTPVFSISLATRLMKEKKDADMDTYLRRVEQDIEYLKGNVEKVLELASIEDEKSLLQLGKLPIRDFMNRWRNELQGHTESDRIRWESGSEEAVIMADESHLKNALNNLVDNALKYSGNEVEVRLEIHPGHVVWRIHDQGPGIEKIHQEAVFSKFYRVNRQGGQVRGYGLGLSYVRQVIEMMKGTVRLESRPGEGSMFEIKLKRI